MLVAMASPSSASYTAFAGIPLPRAAAVAGGASDVFAPTCGGAPYADYKGAVAGADPVIVHSPATAAVVEAFAGRADFALQDEPRGTGDAVRAALAALPALRPDARELLVLNGDVPRMRAELLVALLEERRSAGAPVGLVTVIGRSSVGMAVVLGVPSAL